MDTSCWKVFRAGNKVLFSFQIPSDSQSGEVVGAWGPILLLIPCLAALAVWEGCATGAGWDTAWSRWAEEMTLVPLLVHQLVWGWLAAAAVAYTRDQGRRMAELLHTLAMSGAARVTRGWRSPSGFTEERHGHWKAFVELTAVSKEPPLGNENLHKRNYWKCCKGCAMGGTLVCRKSPAAKWVSGCCNLIYFLLPAVVVLK